MHRSIATLIFLLFFAIETKVQGQVPNDLIGADLKEKQKEYRSKIKKGRDSFLVPYAEALFYDGQLKKALEIYQKADSLELPMSENQQRNYSFAARRNDVSTTLDDEKGYFAGTLNIIADIKAFGNNSEYEDFAPLSWQDILIITSSRPKLKKGKRNTYAFTQQPFLNIQAYTVDGEPVGLDFLPPEINSDMHDGPIAISEDASLVVLTRNYKKPNKNDIHNLYLTYYIKEGKKWSKEMLFPDNDNEYSLQHPFFDNKNNTLYFSSNMPGGYGGFDLYKSKWNGQSWSESANLGKLVNSEYDEVFPSISPDSNLVFATNHIETTGGLDLVMIKEGERYLFPEPFNTAYDDFAISYKNENSGYFSTDRDFDGFGDNIYYFDIVPPPEYPFVVKVVDKESKEAISGVSVSYQATQPSLDDNKYTLHNGEVILHQGPEEPFITKLSVLHEDYYPREVSFDNYSFQNERWVKVVELERLPKVIRDGSFVVYFDNDRPDPRSKRPETLLSYKETYDKYIKRKEVFLARSKDSRKKVETFFAKVKEGMQKLEELSGFLEKELKQGRRYTIEFTSHASPLASEKYNMALSKRRFSSVENYLRQWKYGVLEPYIERDVLTYENFPFGSIQAPQSVPDSRKNQAESVYGVAASLERKVTISWRSYLDDKTDHIKYETSINTKEGTIMDDKEVQMSQECHIIIDSFSSKQEAIDEARYLDKRYTAMVRVLPVSSNGRYRISYGNYANEEEAEAALPYIKRNIRKDAWILVLD